MAEYIVKGGQSIYDIAVEVYGDLMGVSNILRDNENISLETYLIEDSVIQVFPSSTNILNLNIVKYFENKTIIGAEDLSELEALDKIASYGEIITNNVGGDTYINESVWSNNSVNLSNTGLLLDKFNFDRILLSAPILLDSSGGFFEIDFTYNDLGIDQYLFGSTNGSSVKIINNKISLYSLGGVFEMEHSTELVDAAKYRLRGSISSAKSNSPTENIFELSIDGYVESAGSTSFSEVNLSLVGGEDGSRGYEGNISFLNINGSVFNFLKEGGNYIYRTR